MTTYLLDTIETITFDGVKYFPKLIFDTKEPVKLKEGCLFCEYENLEYKLTCKGALQRLSWEIICLDYQLELL